MFPEIFRDDVFRLETRRLWLRWPTARDEAAIERLASDADVAEMTSRIPHPYPTGSAGSFIYEARVGNAQGVHLIFALAPLARPAEAIGAISLRQEDGVATLGYWLGKPFWGRGLMSEAVEAITAAAFHLAAIDAVAAHARADNAASRRVLEKGGFLATGERRVHFPARDAEFDRVDYLRESSVRCDALDAAALFTR